jgi:hypothetical protein
MQITYYNQENRFASDAIISELLLRKKLKHTLVTAKYHKGKQV